MKYKNPKIPEGINVTQTHPLKELILLSSGALAIIAFLAFVIGWTSGYLALLIPFEKEADWANSIEISSEGPIELHQYLDKLVSRINRALDIDEQDMPIKLYYNESRVLNAFATVGGHVVIYRGLLEKLPNENALAMVLAHEIAHIKHRDPIVSVSRGLAISSLLGLLLGSTSVSDILGKTGIYTILKFSRDMEGAADLAALAAINRIYGHTAGAVDLFKMFSKVRDQHTLANQPEFFQSHPLDESRIRQIIIAAEKQGWQIEGDITPLPAQFGSWLQLGP